MEELIKSILILAKNIYDNEEKEHGQHNMRLGNLFIWVYSLKEQDLTISIGVDWSGRHFSDERDLYRYTLVVEPDEFPNDKCIRLTYNYNKKLFLSQIFYDKSGAVRSFSDEKMLKHIQDALEQVTKKHNI